LGAFVLGVTHLIGGFTHQKIALLVLRALGGIGGALTIPSALSLIVQLFPDPAHQARAISLFGSAGAIGNVLGILIGAALVQYSGWSWIFWFVAIIGILIGAVSLFLIPAAKRDRTKNVKFDVSGVSLLTTAVILFIFAVTSGSSKGWATAYVLAPLIISIVLTVVFFWWEAHTNPDDAVLPPRMWSYRNFGVLVTLALLPYFWWVTSFVAITAWWEQVYGWTAINTALHFLPMGIFAWLISNVTGRLPSWFAHKYILIAGLFLTVVATILLPFADAPSTYWPLVFPAFTLGTMGAMIVFANSSIAIFSYTPPHVAGTVGAVFNSALQLGSAVGLAAVSSLSNSIDQNTTFELPLTQWSQHLDQITSTMWKEAFKGRAASYWFLLAILLVVSLAVVVFFKVDVPVHEEPKPAEKIDVEAVASEKQ
jgi:MFS family permease